MLNPKNREASCEINGTLSFWGLFLTYIISHQIMLFGVSFACLSNFMCTWANYVHNDATVPTKYICICIYTHVYSACNREVVGSSPARIELFSENSNCFKKIFSS